MFRGENQMSKHIQHDKTVDEMSLKVAEAFVKIDSKDEKFAISLLAIVVTSSQNVSLTFAFVSNVAAISALSVSAFSPAS